MNPLPALTGVTRVVVQAPSYGVQRPRSALESVTPEPWAITDDPGR
jgi:hypothetical protein